jgi:hypothetical protein
LFSNRMGSSCKSVCGRDRHPRVAATFQHLKIWLQL